MKKLLSVGLLVAVFATCSHRASAYSRTKQPISDTTVTLASVGIGAAAWGLTKLVLSHPTCLGTSVGSHGINVGVGVLLNPLSGKWSTIGATVAASLATWIGLKALSSCTAPGYFYAAQEILSGNKCSDPEVLDLVKMSAGNADLLARSVVDHFSARKNELAKSVAALESLYNQLSLANHYLEVAQKGFDENQADIVEGFRENIASFVTVIKSASMVIKGYEDYERQYQDELKEGEIDARHANARAIRAAAHTTRTHYHLN